MYDRVCVCPAPSVLRECGRHTERQQPDHRVHRWQDVLLESGHALPASGTHISEAVHTTCQQHLKKETMTFFFSLTNAVFLL